MWQASTTAISSTLAVYETVFNSATTTNALQDFGVTLSEFDITYEFRSSGQFKYFYLELVLDVQFDAGSFNADNFTLPESFNGNETVNLGINANVWLSYTDTGLLAGAGIGVNVSLSLTNIPIPNEDLGEITNQDGSISVDFVLEMLNTKFDSIPEANLAGTDIPGDGGDGGFGDIPGFEAFPLLLAIAGLSVLLVVKKTEDNLILN